MNKCRTCGCADLSSCWDEATGTPCFWVEDDLCSKCAGEVSPEEMATAQRISLLYVAIQKCLQENRKPLMIIMEEVDTPGAVTYMADMSVEEAERMLRHLVTAFPYTRSESVDVELQVGKAVQPRREPGRN